MNASLNNDGYEFVCAVCNSLGLPKMIPVRGVRIEVNCNSGVIVQVDIVANPEQGKAIAAALKSKEITP